MNHLAPDGVPSIREFSLTRIPDRPDHCVFECKSDWHWIVFTPKISDLQLLDIGGVAHITYPGKYMQSVFRTSYDKTIHYEPDQTYAATIISYASNHDTTILQ